MVSTSPSLFQIHGVDAEGKVIVRRQLKRRYVLPFFQKLPPCLIGIEACASSHHWSRELKALTLIREGRSSVPKGDLIMLGKLSIIGAVAAILMIPTALGAQMGGALNPGVHVGGAVNPGATVRGAVVQGIPGPDFGTWRSPSAQVHRTRKHSTAATKPRR
jgi:hypothetical protein